MFTSSSKRGVIVAVVAMALALPSTAAAGTSFDIAVSQTESADPVQRGAPVTYTVTMVNQGSEAFPGVGLDLFSLTPGRSGAVANPYQSFTSSQGECVIEPAGDYQQVVCALGSLAPGASLQVTATVQANHSMDHVAGLLLCEFGPSSCQAYSDQDPSDDEVRERLTVIAPPQITGSKKVKLKGLPEGCVEGDLALKAKAKGADIKGIKAKLMGRNYSERLGRAEGNKLKFTLPGSELEQSLIYELNVNVTRKGKPGLKRSVELQAC
jgi:Domain of unknown function DUF11